MPINSKYVIGNSTINNSIYTAVLVRSAYIPCTFRMYTESILTLYFQNFRPSLRTGTINRTTGAGYPYSSVSERRVIIFLQHQEYSVPGLTYEYVVLLCMYIFVYMLNIPVHCCTSMLHEKCWCRIRYAWQCMFEISSCVRVINFIKSYHV